VEVASGVARMFEVLGAAKISDVGETNASVAVDWDDAAALWQAARKMIDRSGMIFFIVIIEVNELQFLRHDSQDVLLMLYSNP